VWTGPTNQLLRAYPAASAQEKAALLISQQDQLASSIVSLTTGVGTPNILYSMYLTGMAKREPDGDVLLDFNVDKKVSTFFVLHVPDGDGQTGARW